MSVATPPQKIDPPLTDVTRSIRAECLVRWSLRLFGSVDLLALFAVVMPVSWMQAAHTMCGLGEFPQGSLPVYLARSTSLLYAFHGCMLWCLSSDVLRYQPVIRFFGRLTILFGLVLILVDWSAGMPMWWMLVEGPTFSMTGLWLAWWTRGDNTWR
ncbi:MAG: hypothetical protein KDA93_16840 [Planctomycetaceae bacterium]|nr:hypothetical protein [Planctomycetaceae bacterium]